MRDQRQYELFDPAGLGRRPRRGHTLFFGLRPPPAQVRSIRRYALHHARKHNGNRALAPQNLHVTLAGFGEAEIMPPEAIAIARSAGAAVKAEPFEVAFDRVQSFGSPANAAIVLRCAEGALEIKALRMAIADALERQGMQVRRTDFTPHLTLWYSRERLGEEVLARPFRWTVDRLWLIHSFIGQSRHEWPGQWELHN